MLFLGGDPTKKYVIASLFLLFTVRAESASYQLTNIYPLEVCALLATPGDFILQRITDDSSDYLEFGGGIVALTRMKDIFNLTLPLPLHFSHSEFIADIEEGKNIVTWSFYPPIFRKRPKGEEAEVDEHTASAPPEDEGTFRRYANHSSSYRRDFAIYRVTPLEGSLSARENALEKMKDNTSREKYGQMGTCADFVNYAYGDKITSWWNFIPGINELVNQYYPATAIASTDDLARSPETRKICEVSNRVNLVYPSSFKTQILVDDLQEELKSDNEKIVAHAHSVLAFLIQRGILDTSGNILYDKIDLLGETKEEAQDSDFHFRENDRFLKYRR